MYEDFKSLEKIYKYNCEKASDINEHLPVLRELASECDHVTEFGTRWCCSTSALLHAQPKKLICYDISRHKAISIIESLSGETEFVYKQEDTREAVIEETDLLFIDTWHAYDQLIIELTKHGNKARKYIVLHDTETFKNRGDTLKGKHPGVKGLEPAINEFLADNPHWKIWKHYPNNNGLTVLKRKS